MNAMTAILSMPDDLPFTPSIAYREVQTHAAVELETSASDMRGQLVNRADIVKFLEAGNAMVTIVSKKSGTRFTYKFSRPKEDNQNYRRPIWVSVLTGPDNNNSHTFAGSIWINPTGYTFAFGRNCTLSQTAPSLLLLSWFLKHLNAGSDEQMTKQAEFWHEGRCGRCGRRLTVPGSIESGFGPECITKV